MNINYAEFKVPFVVTLIGLGAVVILALSPRGEIPDDNDVQLLANTEAILELNANFDKLTDLIEQRTAALDLKIDKELASFNLQSITTNKAMGRISARIAKQSKNTQKLQTLFTQLSTDNKHLSNHTQTLDSAVVQQHRRHQKALKALQQQRSEIQDLLKLNTQIGELFSSFGKPL